MHQNKCFQFYSVFVEFVCVQVHTVLKCTVFEYIHVSSNHVHFFFSLIFLETFLIQQNLNRSHIKTSTHTYYSCIHSMFHSLSRADQEFGCCKSKWIFSTQVLL